MNIKSCSGLRYRASSVVLPLAFLLSCGGSGTQSGGAALSGSAGANTVPLASVTVTLSDPAVCSTSQGGPFQHIYVTISDVQAYVGPTTQNGVDLTPSLSQSPAQVDLLGAPGAGCILATLGSAVSVAPGTYQTLQVFLAGSDQTSKIKGGTKCGNTPTGVAANCAVLADGSAIMLDPGTTGSFGFQASITGGQIALAAGSQVLNIDFDSCASMVFAYAGEYGMDPTMHAALMPSAGSITGQVLDAGTQQPIAGDLIVALEHTDSTGVDREVMQTAPGPDGSFVLCPVPPGSYDVVATAVSNTGISYAATITTGVKPGNALGIVPLHPVTGVKQTSATLTGQVTAAAQLQMAGYTHLVISALQSVSVDGANLLVTIPLPSQYASAFRTIGTGSMNYEVYVPAGNPFLGAFLPNGETIYAQNATQPVTYEIEAQSSCNPATGQTPSGIAVSPGSTSLAPTITLTGCPTA